MPLCDPLPFMAVLSQNRFHGLQSSTDDEVCEARRVAHEELPLLPVDLEPLHDFPQRALQSHPALFACRAPDDGQLLHKGLAQQALVFGRVVRRAIRAEERGDESHDERPAVRAYDSAERNQHCLLERFSPLRDNTRSVWVCRVEVPRDRHGIGDGGLRRGIVDGGDRVFRRAVWPGPRGFRADLLADACDFGKLDEDSLVRKTLVVQGEPTQGVRIAVGEEQSMVPTLFSRCYLTTTSPSLWTRDHRIRWDGLTFWGTGSVCPFDCVA